MSDPVPVARYRTWRHRLNDVIAVLDAAGAVQLAVLGVQDGTLIAMLLAATHPERCGALVCTRDLRTQQLRRRYAPTRWAVGERTREGER